MKTILRRLCALPMLAAWMASMALTAKVMAQPPVASTEVTTGERPGVTLYQASGLKGSIPLKKVYKVDPSGDTGHYVLEFASSNMNTEMEIMAKFVVPSGMTFVSFELSTANGPQQVTTAGADSWDGKTLVDKVTVSPWNMNRVLQQCTAQLDNGDGTFKNSATFDLQADSTEIIRGKGIAKFPNAPPGSASSSEGTVRPRTRVTAYIVFEDRQRSDGRVAKPLSANKTDPLRVAPMRIVTPRIVAQPTTDRLPRTPAARLTSPVQPLPAKDRFERTKPHVNAPIRPLLPGAKPQPRQR
jgi:hypothetical protein